MKPDTTTGHDGPTGQKQAKTGQPDTRARVRETGHVRCPASPFTMSGGPRPSGAMSALSQLRANYKKAGKLIEAKAIDSAINAVRKEENRSWFTELESTLASPAQSLSWPAIKWPEPN